MSDEKAVEEKAVEYVKANPFKYSQCPEHIEEEIAEAYLAGHAEAMKEVAKREEAAEGRAYQLLTAVLVIIERRINSAEDDAHDEYYSGALNELRGLRDELIQKFMEKGRK
jgi:hypothetical protein